LPDALAWRGSNEKSGVDGSHSASLPYYLFSFYCTFNTTVAVRTADPEVALMIRVYCPAGVPVVVVVVGVDPQLADNPRTTRKTPARIPSSQRRLLDIFPPAMPSNANPETGRNKAYSGPTPRRNSVVVVTRCVV